MPSNEKINILKNKYIKKQIHSLRLKMSLSSAQMQKRSGGPILQFINLNHKPAKVHGYITRIDEPQNRKSSKESNYLNS